MSNYDSNVLGLSVLELVGRLGSFGVTERRKPIGFRFPHHVYERAHRLLNSMLAVVCTHPPDSFLWTSLKGRTIIREILEERIPQWTIGPRPTQLYCWTQSLWAANDSHRFNWLGKGDRIFVPILVLRHLVNHLKPRIPRPPSSPVALVVTPHIEMGNAHVST